METLSNSAQTTDPALEGVSTKRVRDETESSQELPLKKARFDDFLFTEAPALLVPDDSMQDEDKSPSTLEVQNAVNVMRRYHVAPYVHEKKRWEERALVAETKSNKLTKKV